MNKYDGYDLYINGEFVRGKEQSFEVINPCNEEILGTIFSASKEQINEAIDTADIALQTYKELDTWQRAEKILKVADFLKENIDEIATILTKETGKPLAQSRREIHLAKDQFIWFSEQTKRIQGKILQSRNKNTQVYINYEPIGIVAAFSSWNFPLLLSARKIAPALAAGCPIIVRSSDLTPLVTKCLFKALHRAEFPKGMVSLLCGNASLISSLVMNDTRVRKISLTGSTFVGRQMIKDSSITLKKVTMELGGHAPVIIHEDVNVEEVAALCVKTKFANAGQVCVSPTRFYIHSSIMDEFCECFRKETLKIKLGNGLDEDVDMGPLITKKRVTEIESFIEKAKENKGQILCGGKRAEGFTKGYFFEPTVIRDLPDTSPLLCDEIFGPIALLQSFSALEEVFQKANSTEYALASYSFTTSLEKAQLTAQNLSSGMVGINSFALAAAEIPFGGIKASGFGRESGEEGMYEYLHSKIITQQYK
ncbi:NAD-dependent succinate-semialdehyde dehydrogenase [Campylobacter sp. MIT 21-1685]|uniref:NAD-dependent succinate-semialdehyde dehydrogenase n=1 Tax=unclassified Campylobacter TaxID=2593542 RepID=UPI00224A6598|nr:MULTISPECIES: NAD-dependent succinate-semialdehyde dehydrogenase [unclassified Campylobacter]MCX2682513.1 NAD-dependent succinate-semialdehyde dehydrogenase [Campylobacter sp. MIT 21-1684]MCX2750774.1 NAD-dependent succinate-semialdehyde dehydrogenase [Campylobacter sp. MIT 21-1682]MCX2806994.1 NAD-dependent succinate-semialdehyde dehydrogenase [Campylobacter sp. MIT 21-1685]